MLPSVASQIGRALHMAGASKVRKSYHPAVFIHSRINVNILPKSYVRPGNVMTKELITNKKFGNGKKISIFIPKYLSLCQLQVKI